MTNPTDWLFGETQDAYSTDYELLTSLGLRTTDFGRDWTDIGTVVVTQEWEDEDGDVRTAPTVKVEVSALPAQFFRFTVTRYIDESPLTGRTEQFEITTGSGYFTEYWPTAVAVAENMLSVRKISQIVEGDETLA